MKTPKKTDPFAISWFDRIGDAITLMAAAIVAAIVRLLEMFADACKAVRGDNMDAPPLRHAITNGADVLASEQAMEAEELADEHEPVVADRHPLAPLYQMTQADKAVVVRSFLEGRHHGPAYLLLSRTQVEWLRKARDLDLDHSLYGDGELVAHMSGRTPYGHPHPLHVADDARYASTVQDDDDYVPPAYRPREVA